MKTKELFLLVAATLLVSINASAQITEAELKNADVNGDGSIDVADMNGIICIMNELGDPNGEYRYYLGEVAAEDAENKEFLETLIQNSSSIYHGKPSKITLPEYSDNNSVVIWIYDETMGYPAVTHNGFGTGDGDADDVGIALPKGYKMKFWSNGGFQVDIRWLAAYNAKLYNSGIQYDDGDAIDAETPKVDAVDLAGRRIRHISRPGVYVIGRRKVLVK